MPIERENAYHGSLQASAMYLDCHSHSIRSSCNEPGEFRESARESGVGILMHQDISDMKIYVKKCIKGGSAERDERIAPGDVILSIDGVSTAGQSLVDIRPKILGLQGSSVRVGFQRNNGEFFEAVLIRGSPEYFESLHAMTLSGINRAAAEKFSTCHDTDPSRIAMHDAERRVAETDTISSTRDSGSGVATPHPYFAQEAELLHLRSRVGDLESDLRITREELGRARQLLQHDREASMGVSRDTEMMQMRFSGQVEEMQVMLAQSERARRELEAQLSGTRAREESHLEDIRRAREHADAREAEARRAGEAGGAAAGEAQLEGLLRRAEAERAAADAALNRESEARRREEAARQQAELLLERMVAEVDRIHEAEARRASEECRVRERLAASARKLGEARLLEERSRVGGMAALQALAQWHDDFFSNRSREEAEVEQFFLA